MSMLRRLRCLRSANLAPPRETSIAARVFQKREIAYDAISHFVFSKPAAAKKATFSEVTSQVHRVFVPRDKINFASPHRRRNTCRDRWNSYEEYKYPFVVSRMIFRIVRSDICSYLFGHLLSGEQRSIEYGKYFHANAARGGEQKKETSSGRPFERFPMSRHTFVFHPPGAPSEFLARRENWNSRRLRCSETPFPLFRLTG